MPCPVTAAHSASVSGRTDSRETNCQIFTIWSRAGCKSRKNDPNCSTKCSAVTTLLTNQLNFPFFFRSSAPFWKADVPRLFFYDPSSLARVGGTSQEATLLSLFFSWNNFLLVKRNLIRAAHAHVSLLGFFIQQVSAVRARQMLGNPSGR